MLLIHGIWASSTDNINYSEFYEDAAFPSSIALTSSTTTSAASKTTTTTTTTTTVPASELILVTSNGNSPDYVGNVMGLYKLMSRRHNNAPAYQQLNTVSGKQSRYIYKYDADTWLGGLKLGSSSGYLYNRDSSPAPPISGWQYGRNCICASDSLLSTVGLKGKHGKKNLATVLSMGFFEDNLLEHYITGIKIFHSGP